MTALLLTISVLEAAFFLAEGMPWLAGFVAVIPVKIIGASWFACNAGGTSHLESAIAGMLVGQAAWLAILLIAYYALRAA